MGEKSELFSVKQAKAIIAKTAKILSPVNIYLNKSFSMILAESIISPIDSPPFNSSTRDGFALIYNDMVAGKPIVIKKSIKAGSSSKQKLKSGEAVRIYTGAPLPYGADTVVMQEFTEVETNQLIINTKNVNKGDYINKQGSQVLKGEIALKQGSILTPAAIGYLSALGIKKVSVYRQPEISLIVTGDEFSNNHTSLKNGKIFEASSEMIAAALKQIYCCNKAKTYFCKDNPARLLKLIKKVLSVSDLVITTGGVSVGKYDYLIEAYKQAKITTAFHKISQTPGKPLFFGTQKDKLIFGLPGNPASSLVCFYEYVSPAIRKMSGFVTSNLTTLQLPITTSVRKTKGIARFLKARTDFKTVTPLPHQESHYLNSFSLANCLIYLKEKSSSIKKGTVVEVHLFASV